MALAETGSFEISNAEALSYADQLDPGFVSMVGDCLAISNHDPEATLACAYEWMQVQNSSEANPFPKYAEAIDGTTKSSAFLLASAIPGATVVAQSGIDCVPVAAGLGFTCLRGTAIAAFTDGTGTAVDSLAGGICYAVHDEPVVVTSVICRASNDIPVAGAGHNFATTPPFVVGRPNVIRFEAAGIQPGGVVQRSTRVLLELTIPGCNNCSVTPTTPGTPEPPPTTEPPLPIDPQ